MEKLINKYYNKLIRQNLCHENTPIIGGLDDRLIWNNDSDVTKILSLIFDHININSIIFAPPSEPYFSILNYLSRNNSTICPEDCETRTFLHDIPVIKKFDLESIVEGLKSRKGIFISNRGIITYGTVTPEQAFVTFSSICFSAYIKFFNDFYNKKKENKSTDDMIDIFHNSVDEYDKFVNIIKVIPDLKQGPFATKDEALKGMIEAGKNTVDCRMVDSFFGNISYKLGDRILISQTGSSLDDLSGYIDDCPIDGSSCSSVTASSEYSSHKTILTTTDNKAILHGHPKYSVIVSMLCNKKNICEIEGQCHIKCPDTRHFIDIPIVPGEVGTGPRGLCNTLPPAIKNNRGVIVYGHGVFTAGKDDFIEPFKNLIDIEISCFNEVKKWG